MPDRPWGDPQPLYVECMICKRPRVAGQLQPVMSDEGLRMQITNTGVGKCPNCGGTLTRPTTTVSRFVALETLVRGLPVQASVDEVAEALAAPTAPPEAHVLRSWLIEHSVELASFAIAIPALVMGILQFADDPGDDPPVPVVIVEHDHGDGRLAREVALLRRELREALADQHPGGEDPERKSHR